MGWAVGYDSNLNRDIGYGVPAICDAPGCEARIDRGLSYVCGSEPYGGEHGCGMHFCSDHLFHTDRRPQRCHRCVRRKKPYKLKPDVREWAQHKLSHESWDKWRTENIAEVNALRERLETLPLHGDTGDVVSSVQDDKLKGGEGAGALDKPAPRESFSVRAESAQQGESLEAANGAISEGSAGRPPPELLSPPPSNPEEYVGPPAMACDYTGREFGASYPDSVCIDGYLWDADSCDEPGGGLRIGGDIPCPKCNAAEHAAWRAEDEDE